MLTKIKQSIYNEEKKLKKRLIEKRRALNGIVAGSKLVDVLVVGAGPVGLFCAWQIKSRQPHLTVRVLEKRTYEKAFVRQNTVKIEAESLITGLNKKIDKKLFENLKGIVKISKIQKYFLEEAKKKGVQIVFGYEVSGKDQIKKEYPNTKYVIGADGRRSIIRKDIFANKYALDTVLQKIVQIKYELKKGQSGQKLETQHWFEWLKLLQLNEKVNHAFTEITSKREPTAIRLFIPIHEKEYTLIKNKLEKLKQLEIKLDDKIVEDTVPLLFNSVKAIVEKRKQVLNETIVDTPTIRPITLDLYQSKKVYTKHKNVSYMLVGDSSFGLPYFRACNVGLLCATELSKSIVSQLEGTCTKCKMKKLNKKGCVHTGSWHDDFRKCGFVCAFNLSLSKFKYGQSHWSCCYSTQKGIKSKKGYTGCSMNKHSKETKSLAKYQKYFNAITQKEADSARYTAKSKKILVWLNQFVRNVKRRVGYTK